MPFATVRSSSFVPENLDAASWDALNPLYAALLARPIASAADLERFLLDRSELDAAVSQAGTDLQVRMTCHTDDPDANAAYVAFVEHVSPKVKQAAFDLDQRLASSPFARELPSPRYDVLVRDTAAAVELFRPENIDIETRLALLDQEYSQTCGAMVCDFRGQRLPLARMAAFLEETDRATRRDAYEAIASRRFQDRDRIDAIYDQMISLRTQAARNAGHDSFVSYAFRAKRRFDYSPADCHAFASGVLESCVPILRRLALRRSSLLGVSPLRPYDLAVDPRSRPPLRPFRTAPELVAATRRMLARIDPVLSSLFNDLADLGPAALDLESRTGKAPGGYQASRDRDRIPFIFMNAAGLQRDVETMVHECGHAFHSLLSRNDPLVAYRSDVPIEFAEVASMSMELLSHDCLDEFYTPADAARARRNHLESIVALFSQVACVDQFQHAVYSSPSPPTPAQRADLWSSLARRYSPEIDFSSYEHFLGASWQRIPHLFGSPFYYIEYAIAQLGALQVWMNHQHDPRAALDAYRHALSLGGSRPLPDLFHAANIRFDMSPAALGRVAEFLEQRLASLPE